MTMQPQLMPIALNPRDVVYTPDDFAQQERNMAQMEQCADELRRLRASKADTERRLAGG